MEASDIVDGFFVKFILWGILTALAYHIAGGIRHLLMLLFLVMLALTLDGGVDK